jgi:hypothetical protein
MAKAKRFLSTNLFNQITLFSIGGMSMSMALVLAYDLRIESWM